MTFQILIKIRTLNLKIFFIFPRVTALVAETWISNIEFNYLAYINQGNDWSLIYGFVMIKLERRYYYQISLLMLVKFRPVWTLLKIVVFEECFLLAWRKNWFLWLSFESISVIWPTVISTRRYFAYMQDSNVIRISNITEFIFHLI